MDQETGEAALMAKDRMRSPLRSFLLALLLAFFSVVLPHHGQGLRLGSAENAAPLSGQGLDKPGAGLQPLLFARSELIRKVQAPRPSQKPLWLGGGADAALLPDLPQLARLRLPEAHGFNPQPAGHGLIANAYWARAPPSFLFLV